ncbi:HAD family hydrolase [Streptomyces sp. BI20]|uniref:HAD family hydrolase n=1 Tax=Streptomyces sp. BI20 TaxID=3403460 RepID=UPI003C7456C6
MTRLHLFDLDGTLIRDSAAPVEISRQLGLEREIVALERAFSAGLPPAEFARELYALWSGLTAEHVRTAFDGAPWLLGIREVWREIRARGEHCAVVSLSPSFFVELLLDWGADAAHGSVFPAPPFGVPVVPLDPAGLLTPAGKVVVADRLCARFGLTRKDCVAYGDSNTDEALFAAVPISVAVNARPWIAARATHVYQGEDLRDAFALVPGTGPGNAAS